MFPLSNVLTKCLPKNVRILCTLKQKLNDKQGAINTNFIPIYKFPYIRVCSIINRLKLYQTFLTITSVPGTKILSDMNIIENDIVTASLVFGISGMMIFYTLGHISSKFVGLIYVSEDRNTIKVSSVDFWGNRKDEVISTSDIVPFSDLPVSMVDALYMKITRFSKTDHLKLNVKFGIVIDAVAFNKIFK